MLKAIIVLLGLVSLNAHATKTLFECVLDNEDVVLVTRSADTIKFRTFNSDTVHVNLDVPIHEVGAGTIPDDQGDMIDFIDMFFGDVQYTVSVEYQKGKFKRGLLLTFVDNAKDRVNECKVGTIVNNLHNTALLDGVFRP